MKKSIFILIFVSFFMVGIVNAGQPDWAGSGKEAKEEMKSQKDELKGRYDNSDMDDIDDKIKQKKEQYEDSDIDDIDNVIDGEDQKAFEKERERERERERETLHEQKELGKGSETGQESRENRKKWWKFWE